MAVSSQEFEFLDLSGVEDERECERLLSLIDDFNPAVEVLASDNVQTGVKNLSQISSPLPNANSVQDDHAYDQQVSDVEIEIEGNDADKTIFFPDPEEYGDEASKSDVQEFIPASEIVENGPEEAESAVISEDHQSETTEAPYPSESNGPPPTANHIPDAGRPEFSPRPPMGPPPGNMYTMPPPNMYPPQGPPAPSAVPTVYVAQCHVNVGAFNGQPQNGAMIPTQHPQAYNPYMMQEPQQQHIHMKNMHDKEYEQHRYQGNNYRGYNKERGKGRGRVKTRRREEHERSNSVSSDHSSYSDSGKHYKDNSMNAPPSHFPGHIPHHQQQHPIPYSVQYSLGMHGQYMIQNNLAARSAQGTPLMYAQHPNQPFMSAGHYSAPPSMLAYPPHPPPHMPMGEHVMHPSLAYSQGSMIPPHQGGVYFSHTPADGMVSLGHEQMMDPNDLNQPIPIDPSVQMNHHEEVKLESPVVHDPANNYMEPLSTNNVSAKPFVPSVNTTESDVHHNDTNINASPGNTSPKSTQFVPPGNETPSEKGTKQVPQVYSTTPDVKPTVSNSPVEIKTPNPSPVTTFTISPKENIPNGHVDQVIVEMNTKLQITPTPVEDIGEISFMEESPTFDEGILKCDNNSDPLNPVTQLSSSPKKPASPLLVVTSSSSSMASLVSPTSKEFSSPDHETKPVTKITVEEPKPVEEVPEVAISPPGGAWAQKKSWSELFKPHEDPSGKRVAYVTPFVSDASKSRDSSPAGLNNFNNANHENLSEADLDKAKIGAMLKTYQQNYHATSLQPRGLINKGYWCYVNAPLQALLACPPFYNLNTSIPNVAGLKKGKSATPVIDSMVEFVSEFSPVSNNLLKMNRKEKSSAQAMRKEPDVVPGPAFEPTYMYRMLAEFGGEKFKEGRQQDADEMLSCVLNGLHDEMVAALKLAGINSPESMNGTMNGDHSDHEEEIAESDQDDWQVIGPRRRSCVTRTAHFTPSPVSDIFWGQLRYVQQKGVGNITANLQPFITLPLDIQATKVETVRDALEQLVSREDISYQCPKTNEELTLSNQVLLEGLPQVMILQLKRFIYNQDGGLQKVTKKVSFSIDLEITKELLSPNSRNKFTNNERKYRLLAVIYHDGKEATKGHYVADIYHSGYNCWLHYDDSVVKPVSESVVLKHAPPRVPYLLFYRRVDTMSGAPSSKQKT